MGRKKMVSKSNPPRDQGSKRGPLDFFFEQRSKVQKVESKQTTTSLPSTSENIDLDQIVAPISSNDQSANLNQVDASPPSNDQRVDENQVDASLRNNQSANLNQVDASPPSNDQRVDENQVDASLRNNQSANLNQVDASPPSNDQRVDENQVDASLRNNQSANLNQVDASPPSNDQRFDKNQVDASLSNDQSATDASPPSNDQRVDENQVDVSPSNAQTVIDVSPLLDDRTVDENQIDDSPNMSLDEEEDAYMSLERDPGLRLQICRYPVNQREDVRRAYLRMGPYQPKLRTYPLTKDKSGKQYRAFNKKWYEKFLWLEYSPAKDRAYCFPCFVFESSCPKHSVYTVSGFNSWKYVSGAKCSLETHVGGLRSPHRVALSSCGNLMKPSCHINNVMNNISNEEILKNRTKIGATIDACMFLALQGCAFRGHDESSESNNRGNVIEFISAQAKKNPAIAAVVLDNAPGNAIYIAPSVQKKILHIIGERVRMKIREEVGDAKFCILVDEAQDNADKEQMAIILRFVDEMGFVRERFFNIVSVKNTNSLTMKGMISNALAYYDLRVENMRGQGYDGASNMRGAWNGLQALFLQECPYAYFVHCFAHRLQLALVAAAAENKSVWKFFSKLDTIVNLVGASPKRKMELQEAKEDELMYLKAIGELEGRKGANQTRNLQKAGATRWSSHFRSISSLIDLYDAASKVLEGISLKGSTSSIRHEASSCYKVMRSYEFVFTLHLLHKSMGITNLLCKALQDQSQDILNAMSLVSSTEKLLQTFKDGGWSAFLQDVTSFCEKHAIVMPKMESPFMTGTGRLCQQKDSISMEHHYRIDTFIKALDYQLMELRHRFSKDTVELLTLSSALSPMDKFKSFKIEDICKLVQKFYPQDFDEQEVRVLKSQLEHYQYDVVLSPDFQKMSTLSELCRGLVETRKQKVYTLVDRLIRLVLTLPVSTATTERAFSVMKRLKTDLRNKMEDEFLRDCMIINIERDFAKNIDLESVIDEYDALENHRVRFR